MAKDIDTTIGFWLNNVPYVYTQGNDERTTYRHYITPKGNRVINDPTGICSWIGNYFMFISLYDAYDEYAGREVRVNGTPYDDPVWMRYFSPYMYTDLILYDGTVRDDLTTKLMLPRHDSPARSVFELVLHTFGKRRDTVERDHTKPPEAHGLLPYVEDILNNEFPTAKYDPRLQTNNIHWGQMKLILTEIEFLTAKARNDPTVVLYIGGAPGNHIPYLSMMFPNVLFILYDPLPFSIQETDRIIIHQELFTDDTVERMRNIECLLISDIRTPRQTRDECLASHPEYGRDMRRVNKEIDRKFEQDIVSDMELQKRLVTMIRPVSAMFKFRLAFPPKKTQTYLASSTILIQPFAKPTSTEQRMWIDRPPGDYSLTEYDLSVVEERFFYFNTRYRPATFYDIDEHFGYNYDTLRMANILKRYVIEVGLQSSVLPLMEEMDTLVFSLVYGIENVINRRDNKHQITKLL
uniref:Cap-specific mRNA (nucleoside-2'-O-)-methyltransferase n=1 Tax=viral metagenome TaxID=1070528 RepID=A0A6C0M140_9ZZZZ